MRESQKIKVLIGPSTFAELDPAPMNRLLEAGFEVIENPFKRKFTREEVISLLGDNVQGLLAGLEPLDKSVLERTRLKVLSRVGSGLSNVDLAAARELGVKVFSTPDGPTQAVAELTLGAMLGLMRMVSIMDQDLHEGKWTKKIGIQLRGKTVAIIGFGRIGRRVADLLAPFQTSIVVVDPAVAEGSIPFPLLSLRDAIEVADVITIHCSGGECVLGRSELALVKEGALLLNAARGGQVDEAALVEALQKGRIAGAWLDVFTKEPYQGTLLQYPQVLLTPHVGSYTRECRREMECDAVENLIRGFMGEGGDRR